MQIIIEILKIILFLSWILFTVYTFFQLKRNTKTLANKCKLTVPFECKKCHSIFEYPYDVYLKIIKVVRTDYQARFGAGIRRYKEFKFLCKKCGSKQWQRQIRLYPFVGSPCEAEYRYLLIKAVAKIFVIGILASLSLSLLSL